MDFYAFGVPCPSLPSRSAPLLPARLRAVSGHTSTLLAERRQAVCSQTGTWPRSHRRASTNQSQPPAARLTSTTQPKPQPNPNPNPTQTPNPNPTKTQPPPQPQDELAYFLPHAAGLNPKAFRARYARTPRALAGGATHTRPVPPGGNALLMGDLVFRFAGLDLKQQARLAAALGVTRHEVLADLRAVAAATAFL